MSLDIRTAPVTVPVVPAAAPPRAAARPSSGTADAAAPVAAAAPAADAPATGPAPAGGATDAATASGAGAAAIRSHVRDLAPVLRSLEDQADLLEAWGVELVDRLSAGHRLLAAGNGGSAAEAQHLTSEFVGRFAGDRPSFSAISLHAESSAVTAIGNDYGYDQVFARQVRGHGRAGDVLVLLSTSGSSANLIEAAHAAREVGVTTWAVTGPGPNPLVTVCDEALTLEGPSSNVQEAQLVAVHALCLVFDAEVARRGVTGPDRGARS